MRGAVILAGFLLAGPLAGCLPSPAAGAALAAIEAEKWLEGTGHEAPAGTARRW